MSADHLSRDRSAAFMNAFRPFAADTLLMGFRRALPLLVLFLLGVGTAQAVPEIQQWTTARGTKVFFARTEGLPLVDVRVLFDAGSARDGQQFGLATMTAALLDTGAGDWDADTIAKRLEGVGALLDTSASRDSASLSLRTLTKPELMKVALETAREILLHPRFETADFEREKKRILLSIKQREEAPDDLAGIAFFEALYRNHPYAHPKEGNRDTVEKLTRDDLARFFQTHYVAKNATVVIVGELDRAAAESMAQELAGQLPEGQALPAVPVPETGAQAGMVRKTFPSEQTHVLAGQIGMKITDPDYFPLYVGNHILGGSGFASRVVKEVREKRGLSYSAYSYFYPFREAGPFLMGLQTRNDQAEQALGVLQQTLKDFIDKGPTEQELKAAKQNITGGFVLRLDSNKKLAEQIASIGFFGLPLDWLNTFISKVEAVTAADIHRAFRARIHPNQLQTVLVGAPQREQ
ncbi:MAG: insulinase family protein [Methylotetracoccus sp.]|nr:insulinase family protein [Methylotetracoccus sp.]